MFAMGILVASLSPTEKASNIIANLLYFPMIFLSGATLPNQIFPPVLQRITRFLPLTHGVELLKGAWTGKPLSQFGTEIVVLAATAVGFTLLGVITFRWE